MDGEALGLVHELGRGLEPVPVRLDHGLVEARRDGQDAQQQEHARRRRVVLDLLREPLLGDEAQLVVVPREGVDAVDDGVDRREQIPLVF